jgi:transposase
VLSADPTPRVYLVRGVTDLRKSFDALAGLVRESLEHDPLSGDLFVFCSRQRRLIKILYWDGTGVWVLAKRLDRGRYRWPKEHDLRAAIDMTQAELDELLGGIDLRRGAWRRVLRPTPKLPAPPLLPA